MLTHRLDRLSAVLEGLTPQIVVRFAGRLTRPMQFAAEESAAIRMHLITEGKARISQPDGTLHQLSGPAIAIFRSEHAHCFHPEKRNTALGVMFIDAHFDGPVGSLLMETFEQPLTMSLERTDSELDLVIRLIAGELANPRCGQPALLARAGDILFIGVLRHLLAHPRTSSGLLNGLSDQRIARTLVAIHTNPEMPWNLENMADVAGMSRTAFANQFREMMNHTPGSYLTRLRLSIARRAIDNGHGLKHAAKLSGYASVTALSRALGQANNRPN